MTKTKKKKVPRLENICRKLRRVKPVKWAYELVFAAGPKHYQFRTVMDGVKYRIVGSPALVGVRLSLADRQGQEIESYDDVPGLYSTFEKLVERQRAFDTRNTLEELNNNMHYLLDEAMAVKKKLKK
jgi:hypothetical protein